MNVIESIIIEEALREAKSDKNIEKLRTKILKVYNGPSEDFGEWEEVDYYPSDMGMKKHNPNIPNYIEPTEAGYAGLEPPVG